MSNAEVGEEQFMSRFDDALQEEIRLSRFGDENGAIEGRVRSVAADDDDTVLVEIGLPLETADGFTEKMEPPTGAGPLEQTKLGRLIADGGYSWETSHHLIDDRVKCIYRDSGWSIVDPNPAAMYDGYASESLRGKRHAESEGDGTDENHPFGKPTAVNRESWGTATFISVLIAASYWSIYSPLNAKTPPEILFVAAGLACLALACTGITLYQIYDASNFEIERTTGGGGR